MAAPLHRGFVGIGLDAANVVRFSCVKSLHQSIQLIAEFRSQCDFGSGLSCFTLEVGCQLLKLTAREHLVSFLREPVLVLFKKTVGVIDNVACVVLDYEVLS